jgi:phosphohistidine swiveling domain-containing protein
MKRLDALDAVLRARGYSPVPITSDGKTEVDLKSCTALRLLGPDIAEGNYWEITFRLEADGSISTNTDTDVFVTGRREGGDLVNHAGHGVNPSFELSLIPDYAVEAALLTMAEQGFTCDRANIKVEGDIITIVGTKDTTSTFRQPVAPPSNIVVL